MISGNFYVEVWQKARANSSPGTGCTAKKKRWGTILFAVLIAGLLLAGCRPASHNTGASIAKAQELVVGEQFDLGGYDPSGSMSSFVRSLIYNNLVELDQDFKKVPGLAESWTMSPDGKTWVFKLRRGVVFHDGTPFDAQAAKINLEWHMKGSNKNWVSSISSIETPDPYTLVVKHKTPVFTFASDLTPPFLAMVSPKAIGPDGKLTAAVGTGPFKLTFWEKDSEFVMERNDKYFGGVSNLTKLTFKVIPDAETRAMALESGQIDMMSGREALTAIQRFKSNPEIKIVKRMGQTSELMFFNIYKPPFDDLKVRQAVAHAVNLQEMVPQLLGDLAEPPKNFFSPAYGDFLHPSPAMPRFDQAKSKELLAEAGWKDTDGDGILEKEGQKLKAVLYFGVKNAEDKLLSAAIQAALKNVGMDIELRAVEDAALRQVLEKKDYHLLMVGQWFVPHDDPSSHYQKGYWHSKSTYMIYTSPELDALIDRLAASLDSRERLDLHHQIQAKVLENTPVLVVFHRNNVMAMKKNIDNFHCSVGTWQIFRGLSGTRIK